MKPDIGVRLGLGIHAGRDDSVNDVESVCSMSLYPFSFRRKTPHLLTEASLL